MHQERNKITEWIQEEKWKDTNNNDKDGKKNSKDSLHFEFFSKDNSILLSSYQGISLLSFLEIQIMNNLDSRIVRSYFPALSSDWIFFDNAGGSQTVKYVGERIQDYLLSTNVQLGASYEISQLSGKRVVEAQQTWADAINAKFKSEIVFGPSTTALLQNLSRSMVQILKPYDEIIITNCDHEANIGPWIGMEKYGIVVKHWKINPVTLSLEIEDLKKLMSKKTRLVAFAHVSNILGTINPINEITRIVHDHGALVCVDGVAYAPHRLVDVKRWNVDFYVFSLYKVYGPHYAILYAKQKHLKKLPAINHFFIGENDIPYKLQPGNVNYELCWGSTGIIEYFKAIYKQHYSEEKLPLFTQLKEVFRLIASYEGSLAELLIRFLRNRKGVRIIGEETFEKHKRVPTISFVVEGRKSSEVPLLVDKHKIGIRWGDFYARRLIEDLNLAQNDGIVRVSMVHYNTLDEVEKLIEVLDEII